MYCGGKPEHKHIANKYTYMREEIHAHNNGELTHVHKINAHVMNLQA